MRYFQEMLSVLLNANHSDIEETFFLNLKKRNELMQSFVTPRLELSNHYDIPSVIVIL